MTSALGTPSTCGSDFGPLELLVVQATPFCNIDCRYCYLPARNDRRVISDDTLSALCKRLRESHWLLADTVPFSWHAGEPMAAGVAFYERAIALVQETLGSQRAISHAFQTNGVLIDDRWIDFFLRHRIRLGLSIDGPADIHDRYRRTRTGAGTHARAMRAVARLQERRVPFGVIAVLTRASLHDPDAFYDFFRDHGISRVGLNVEEIELSNEHSTLEQAGVEQEFQAFLGRIFERSLADGAVSFRELDGVRKLIVASGGALARNQLTHPFSVVTCDIEGNVTTFAPELSGARSTAYADFVVGNVHRDSFEAMRDSPVMRTMVADVEAGNRSCEAQCSYFKLCRGGSPGNKFFENGSFATTSTLYCRYSRQLTIETVVACLETKFARGAVA